MRVQSQSTAFRGQFSPNSGCQAWQQVPSPTDPSPQPAYLFNAGRNRSLSSQSSHGLTKTPGLSTGSKASPSHSLRPSSDLEHWLPLDLAQDILRGGDIFSDFIVTSQKSLGGHLTTGPTLPPPGLSFHPLSHPVTGVSHPVFKRSIPLIPLPSRGPA